MNTSNNNFLLTFTLKTVKSSFALYFQPVRDYLNNRPPRPQNRIDSLIGEDMKFEGNLAFNNKGLRIDGHWLGNIDSVEGTIVVSDSATIEGNIKSGFIIINGTIKGNVTANSYIELQKQATVQGNINAPVVEIQMGAQIFGSVETSEHPGTLKFQELTTKAKEISESYSQLRVVK